MMLRRLLMPWVAAAALVAAAGQIPTQVTLQPAGADTVVPGFADPSARAAALALPKPADHAGGGVRNCAESIDVGTVPLACFADPADTLAFIHGIPRSHSVQTLVEAGFGGTDLVNYNGAYYLAKTCSYNTCGSSEIVRWWWSQPSSYSYCTHAYPNNDYKADAYSPSGAPPPFRYYERGYDAASLNCNRVILYQDDFQGGGGAKDIGSASSYYAGLFANAYYSFSIHNR